MFGPGKLPEVTKYWVSLLDKGELPGMSKDQHGDAEGYHLTPGVIESWSDILSKEMISDLKTCKDAYLIAIVTKENQKLRYFFCVQGQEVSLISAYVQEKTDWRKLSGKK